MRDYYDDDPWKTALLLCSIVIGIVGLLVLFLVPWPRDGATWLGHNSPVEAVGILLTPLGAIAALLTFGWNVRNSTRTLEQAVKNEQASRFQKASEMLGSPGLPVSMAGATLLRSIAEQNPKEYLAPVAEILASTVSMIHRDWAVLFNASRTRHTLEFPENKPLCAIALHHLSALNIALGWPSSSLFEGQFPLTSVYLVESTISDLRLSDIIGVQWILDRLTLYKCDFQRSQIEIAVGEDVTFEKCNLSGARLELRDYNGNLFRGGLLPGRLQFLDCQVNGTTVNGQPFEKWKVAFTGEVERRRGEALRHS
ncbi:MAG: hypothetical protein EOP24_07915 [Hyphomicrobiales bacterium]|nr:MAG: hypothetical protein EOP24_07915 [Hyphomicrobiales bacterium]